MNKVLVSIAVVVISGCASGPAQIGKDTYMVSNTGAWSWSSASSLKVELYKEASAVCERQGKTLQPLSDDGVHGGFSNFAQAELRFRCVDTKEAQRPSFTKSPDITIQVK